MTKEEIIENGHNILSSCHLAPIEYRVSQHTSLPWVWCQECICTQCERLCGEIYVDGSRWMTRTKGVLWAHCDNCEKYKGIRAMSVEEIVDQGNWRKEEK